MKPGSLCHSCYIAANDNVAYHPFTRKLMVGDSVLFPCVSGCVSQPCSLHKTYLVKWFKIAPLIIAIGKGVSSCL